MLARLERDGRLGPDSEVKNLGLVMAQFIKIARAHEGDELREECEEEIVELKAPDGSTTQYTFNPDLFGENIRGYAERHGITLPGLSGEKVDEEELADLPIRTRRIHGTRAWRFASMRRKTGKRMARLTRRPLAGTITMSPPGQVRSGRRRAGRNGIRLARRS